MVANEFKDELDIFVFALLWVFGYYLMNFVGGAMVVVGGEAEGLSEGGGVLMVEPGGRADVHDCGGNKFIW